MIMIMKKLIIVLLMAVPLLAAAQDVHFSQFYNSPLTLNPTLTGLMDGRFRVGGLYRSQWNSIADPYTTMSVAFDAPLQKGFADGDLLGLGGVIFYDKAGASRMSTFNFVASFAYHKALSKKGNHLLSLGVQAGITQKGVNGNDGVFADQVDGGLSVGDASAEAQNIDNVLHEDLNIGLSYSGSLAPKVKLFLGGAAFHLTQPKESFIGGDARLPMRFTGNGSLEIGIGKHFSIMPSAVYMLQANTSEVNLGGALGYEFTNGLGILAGLYGRVGDALIPMVGLEYKGANFSFSYDVNNSDLAVVTNGRGGYELSFTYVAPHKQTPYKFPTYFAPRF